MNILTKIIGIGAIALFIVSCGSGKEVVKNHYQIYKVEAASNIKKTNNALIYEDENCEIRYDFWDVGGNAGFLIYNKTDKDLYLNMDQSYFIHNGIAMDYFRNRIFTDESSNSVSRSSTNSSTNSSSETKSRSLSLGGSGAISGLFGGREGSGTANVGMGSSRDKTTSNTTTNTETSTNVNSHSTGVNTVEREKICVPSKTAKIVYEYSVSEYVYEAKNMPKTAMKTNNYSQNDSPFVFSNRISYSLKDAKSPVFIEHSFYVSQIANSSKKEATEIRPEKDATEKDPVKKEFFKDPSPDKFYIMY